MTCEEVTGMRKRMADLRDKLKEQRSKARAHASDSRPGRFKAGRSDFEPLLQRRIQMLAAEIERHIHTHGCQE